MPRRGAIVLVLVLVLVLVRATIATSGSGSGSAATSEDDEELGSAGSAVALVAPKDAGARKHWLVDHVAAAIGSRPAMAKARIAIAITDVATGDELYALNPDQNMNLASNAKLLTSFAALAELGGGFRWRTAVYVDDLDEATGDVKGDLYVRGRGDPTLTPADLRALAADVAAHGVRTVEGQIVIDATYFDDDIEPPHFADQPKERSAFRAPIASLGVARSAITVTVTAEPGGPGKVELDPDVAGYVRLGKNEVTTITTGKTRIRIDEKPKQDHLEIDVSGQIRAADGSYDARKRIDDPLRFAAELLRDELAAHGVKLGKKRIGKAAVPLTAKLVCAHDSAPLSLVIREMNKQSDNYVAETVLKTLGAETRTTPGPATWADGLAAVHARLAKIGLAAGTYRADNGSGLFGASDVSPHALIKLLRAAHADFRIGPDLVASLPVGGVDGTLAKRWHDHAARGRVRAKTGTLDKVTTLAGYVAVEAGHPLAFAILVNDIPTGQRPVARAMADEMLDVMIAYLEK